MKTKPTLIIAGQPKSIFFEIFFKSIKLHSFKSPLILIASQKLIKSEMRKYKFKKKIRFLDIKKDFKRLNIDNKKLNIIDVNYNFSNKTKKKSTNAYIFQCFQIAFSILRKGITNKLINGPINKKQFLKQKHLGITEYISDNFKIKQVAMLIYNKDLSVCPLTTHLPLKLVHKKINKKLITHQVHLINEFYKKNFGYKPKIAITGLNPHCESILKINEDDVIIHPTIKVLKKRGYKVYGPFPADTIFLKQNRKKYNVILGMYHDQVLAPIKTIKEYDAINITLGLPFLRISPDHGPNEKMIKSRSSSPLSLIKAIKFFDQR
jgi:4-hydroxythreonine-4-phosphate dehydrogenase